MFGTAGDGFMLEFGSSLGAVEAAFELAVKCEQKVRVGAHLGDVVVQASLGSALASADERPSSVVVVGRYQGHNDATPTVASFALESLNFLVKYAISAVHFSGYVPAAS